MVRYEGHAGWWVPNRHFASLGISNALPLYGFKEVSNSNYTPQRGDIVVFPAVGGHPFGHIAMWNGHQWVSDFKQKNLICATAYKNAHCRFYRKM